MPLPLPDLDDRLLAVVGVAELRVEGVPTPSLGFGKRKDAAMLESIRGQISGAAMTSRNDLANAIANIESFALHVQVPHA